MTRYLLTLAVAVALVQTSPAVANDEITHLQSRPAGTGEQNWAEQIAKGTGQALRRTRGLRFMWQSAGEEIANLASSNQPAALIPVLGTEAQYANVTVRRLIFPNANDALTYGGRAQTSEPGEFQIVEVRANKVMLITGPGLRKDFQASASDTSSPLGSTFREHAWRGLSSATPSLVGVLKDGSDSGNIAFRTVRQGPAYDAIQVAIGKAREKTENPVPGLTVNWSSPNSVQVSMGEMTATMSDDGQWALSAVGVGGDHAKTSKELERYLQAILSADEDMAEDKDSKTPALAKGPSKAFRGALGALDAATTSPMD